MPQQNCVHAVAPVARQPRRRRGSICPLSQFFPVSGARITRGPSPPYSIVQYTSVSCPSAARSRPKKPAAPGKAALLSQLPLPGLKSYPGPSSPVCLPACLAAAPPAFPVKPVLFHYSQFLLFSSTTTTTTTTGSVSILLQPCLFHSSHLLPKSSFSLTITTLFSSVHLLQAFTAHGLQKVGLSCAPILPALRPVLYLRDRVCKFDFVRLLSASILPASVSVKTCVGHFNHHHHSLTALLSPIAALLHLSSNCNVIIIAITIIHSPRHTDPRVRSASHPRRESIATY